MQTISNSSFEKLVNEFTDKEIILSDYLIEFKEPINIDLSLLSFSFKNCLLRGSRMDFYDFNRDADKKDKYASLSFEDCTIENDLFIKDCDLYQVDFHNVTISSHWFNITSSNINRITINGKSDKRNTIKSLILNNLKYGATTIDMRLNDFSDTLMINNSSFQDTSFNGNTFKQLTIDECVFKGRFEFWKSSSIHTNIDRTDFEEVVANDSTFGVDASFKNVKFFGKCDLRGAKESRSILNFNHCNFHKHVTFEGAKVYGLKFDTVYFSDIASFQHVTCHNMSFHSAHFDKIAFFNDLDLQFDSCDLKTIRVIKNQLSNTENKIDYLKFNALEHKILLRESGLSTNDRILLWSNKLSNNFGISWLRGVLFTFCMSVLFFIALLAVNSVVTSTYPLNFLRSGTHAPFSEILLAFLKFVFSLGFDNSEIQSNGLLYFIFIIAKLFIGYGIYQTVAAFRKYGQN